MKTFNLKLVLLAAIISFGIGMLAGYFMDRNGVKKVQFTFKNGDNFNSIDLDQDALDQKVLLEKIFSEDWSKNAAVSWLKKNQGLFPSIDPAISKEIAMLEIDADLSKDLREVSYKREGPWQYQIDTVLIGFPSNQPAHGEAFACENGDYYRKKMC